jgi:hypothetical protein
MSIIDYLKVFHFSKKNRLGAFRDGGYVIGILSEPYDCYISAGVADEESFSRDFINSYGMNKENAFAFDGTITNYPTIYTEDINFIKKNINSFCDEDNDNLLHYMKTYKNIFLKMDIEGGEYKWLLNTGENDLLSFKQIVMEFHGINDDSWSASYQEKLECFKKITNTHYLVHIHGNNHSEQQNNIPDVVEGTFIRKDCFDSEPELNRIDLPIPNLDFPCYTQRPELNLSFPPFVNK